MRLLRLAAFMDSARRRWWLAMIEITMVTINWIAHQGVAVVGGGLVACKLLLLLAMVVLSNVVCEIHIGELDNESIQSVTCLRLRVDGDEEGDKEGGRTEQDEFFLAGKPTSARRVLAR